MYLERAYEMSDFVLWTWLKNVYNLKPTPKLSVLFVASYRGSAELALSTPPSVKALPELNYDLLRFSEAEMKEMFKCAAALPEAIPFLNDQREFPEGVL